VWLELEDAPPGDNPIDVRDDRVKLQNRGRNRSAARVYLPSLRQERREGTCVIAAPGSRDPLAVHGAAGCVVASRPLVMILGGGGAAPHVTDE
jgi:hypothetical protein